MVGGVKPPMSKKNGEMVLNFVFAIIIGPAPGGVVKNGDAQAYVTSCDVDRDPVEKKFTTVAYRGKAEYVSV